MAISRSVYSGRGQAVFTVPFGADRAIGFDIPGADPTQRAAGPYFSPRSVGHLGFTGTSFWLDLDSGQMVVLLTNRVHLGRDDKTRMRPSGPVFTRPHPGLWDSTSLINRRQMENGRPRAVPHKGFGAPCAT